MRRWGGVFDVAAKRAELSEKQKQTLASDFWDDPKAAEVFMKGISQIKYWVDGYDGVCEALSDLETLMDFGPDASDDIDAAYKAVMKPAEGTILTVSRLAAACQSRSRRSRIGNVVAGGLGYHNARIRKFSESQIVV